jgi:chromate transporter
MMEDEVVRRRRWLAPGEFLDLIGAVNLIPGPNSTEIAIHVGQRRAGVPGLLVAGACFILPAVAIVTALAWAYVRFGSRPAAEGLLYGIKPVIIAIVAQALWRLGRTALKSGTLGALALAVCVLNAAGVDELALLFGAGGAMVVLRRARRQQPAGAAIVLPLLLGQAAPAAFGLWPMFLIFLKIGSVLFGSGYVLLAFLRADFVERRGWLTESQLLDAVAVGQFTPGPVFTTATFIGYLLGFRGGVAGGIRGACVATAGIFLPAFVFVALSGLVLPRVRRSPDAAAFLDGVNAASLALMAVVSFALARAAVVDAPTALLALGAGAALLPFSILIGGGSRLMGRVAETIGPRWPLTVGPIICGAGYALMVRLDPHGSFWTSILPGMAVMALGMAGAVAPLTTAVLSAVDDDHAGTASGFNSAIARTGGLIATALAGAVMAQSGPGLTDAFHGAALIGAGLAVTSGLVAFLTLPKSKMAREPT